MLKIRILFLCATATLANSKRQLAPWGPHARVRARVGDLMIDSHGYGQYLGQYLAPSEDLVTFGSLCDVLEHF